MNSSKTQKINAVAEFASSIYRSHDADEIVLGADETKEEAVLRIAADSVQRLENRGVLEPALRIMLESMDQDYAKILMRIDKIASASKGESLPLVDDTSPIITEHFDKN